MAPDDLREFPLPDPRLLTGDEAEVAFSLNPAAVELPPGERPEPKLANAPPMIGFDDPAPEAEAADPDPPLLDVARAVDEPEPRMTDQERRDWIIDLTAAVGVHLLSFLVFMYWTAAPAEVAPPIPVTLVLEEPPPKPAPPRQAKPETKPPPGRLASIAIGDPAAKPAKPAAATPPVDEPQKPRAAPPRRPAPPRPELVSALPKPAPMPEPQLKLSEPVAPPAAREPAAPPPPVRHAAVRPAPHSPAERPWGKIPGPAATQDEYLAYANALIRHYQEMIPRSLLSGRSGIVVISILVLADGTIARVAIKESSGYPEIDQRAERMVAAVKRFPPLPQWFQGPSMMLSYHMIFGDRMALPY